MKAVVAAFNQEKALVGAFSVITNLRMEIFEALLQAGVHPDRGAEHAAPGLRAPVLGRLPAVRPPAHHPPPQLRPRLPRGAERGEPGLVPPARDDTLRHRQQQHLPRLSRHQLEWPRPHLPPESPRLHEG